jgi:carbonic anhydrase
MARVAETAKGQKPFAVVVCCSDSRLPPEILFDQGLGDLFVVRTAGEVVTEVELGSIEYAIEHLGAQYIVAMGHKKCGAVDATVKGGELPPNIEAIAEQIRPAVESARFFKGDLLDNSIRENAKLVLKKIKGSDILSEAFKSGKLNFKAAYYDIETGKVSAL